MKELRFYFDRVDVLTTTNQNILPKSELPLDGLNVRLLRTFDYRRISHYFRKPGKTHFSESTKSNGFIKWMIRLNESFPFNLFLGEGGLVYIIHGVYVANKLLKSADEKYIFSSFKPTANICIGYIVKLLNPKAVWISNFHDIPVDNVRINVVLPSLQHWFWKKILKPCDLVTTVSEGVGNHIRKYNDHVHVMINGVVVRQSVSSSNTKFIFCYTGSLYAHYRNPSILFEAIARLVSGYLLAKDAIEIRYAGKDGDLWQQWINEYQLDDISTIYGDVSPEKALILQEEAHINILLTWTDEQNTGILTGKLFEYLGATNSIFAIVNGPEDKELAELFDTYKCGFIFNSINEDSIEELKKQILLLFTLWKSNAYPDPFINPDLLKSLNWESQVKNLMQKLQT